MVIAELQDMGPCIVDVLRVIGISVTLREKYLTADWKERLLDLVIVTNTSLTPPQITRTVPDIKARHPGARIMVLSGYSAEEWVTDLKLNGVDRFLLLPFQITTLQTEVSGLLLSGPASAV